MKFSISRKAITQENELADGLDTGDIVLGDRFIVILFCEMIRQLLPIIAVHCLIPHSRYHIMTTFFPREEYRLILRRSYIGIQMVGPHKPTDNGLVHESANCGVSTTRRADG